MRKKKETVLEEMTRKGLVDPFDSPKATNPKDAVASNKLPLHLVPDILEVYCALGLVEGEAKYGRFNYRVAGARLSVYASALKRHMKKWMAGEDVDPKTRVPHLASMLACIAIVLDADLVGKLVDDRPPRAPRTSQMIDELESLVAHVREVFKDKHPRHYQIGDEAAPSEPPIKASRSR